MATVKFLEKDQNWQNGSTNYWFDVDSEQYAICDEAGELSLLDCDGCPIPECNDHENIKDLLTPEYEKHIND